jgi:glycosyltransferase involved in cell wall biosynthesis
MTKGKQELSVVLATFNEEKNLSALFDSIKDLADEVVIVDGSSTDRTAEIAKKHGARVVVAENLKNFHINKQKAIDLATKEWILQLDADERVSEELAKEIKSKLASNSSENDGYWIARKNWFLGRFLMKGGQYPDYTLRLYRKGKGYLPQIHVHEQAEVIGSVGYLKHALLHYPYGDFSSYLVKWNRYNDLLASQIVENTKGKNFLVKVVFVFGYLIIKPTHWFLTTYIRHKGFVDGWPGFVFSFFSAIRFPVSYVKSLKLL